MANLGVCTLDDIALSVMATVISHRPDKGWIIVDAGGLALSKDHGTAEQARDYGYGAVCDADGRLLPGLTVGKVRSEEHTSELQSLMRSSYAVFCLTKKKNTRIK